MRIRPAKETDLRAAAQLWFERIAFLREADANILLAPDASRLWREQAEHWIDADDRAFFVAESAERLAGFVVAGARQNPAWLHPARVGQIVEMVLDLHRPHRGLSSALLERAAAWLQARHIDIVEVEPNACYPVEEAFWRAQGGKLRSRRFWLKL